MNSNEIMRKYADILAEDVKQINESIESGICDVVQTRLTKTMGMVENLMLELEDDEGTDDTVAALRTLLDTIQNAWVQVDEVMATLDSDAPKSVAPTDSSGVPAMQDLTGDQGYDPAYPMADPTGTLK